MHTDRCEHGDVDKPSLCESGACVCVCMHLLLGLNIYVAYKSCLIYVYDCVCVCVETLARSFYPCP